MSNSFFLAIATVLSLTLLAGFSGITPKGEECAILAVHQAKYGYDTAFYNKYIESVNRNNEFDSTDLILVTIDPKVENIILVKGGWSVFIPANGFKPANGIDTPSLNLAVYFKIKEPVYQFVNDVFINSSTLVVAPSPSMKTVVLDSNYKELIPGNTFELTAMPRMLPLKDSIIQEQSQIIDTETVYMPLEPVHNKKDNRTLRERDSVGSETIGYPVNDLNILQNQIKRYTQTEFEFYATWSLADVFVPGILLKNPHVKFEIPVNDKYLYSTTRLMGRGISSNPDSLWSLSTIFIENYKNGMMTVRAYLPIKQELGGFKFVMIRLRDDNKVLYNDFPISPAHFGKTIVLDTAPITTLEEIKAQFD